MSVESTEKSDLVSTEKWRVMENVHFPPEKVSPALCCFPHIAFPPTLPRSDSSPAVVQLLPTLGLFPDCKK